MKTAGHILPIYTILEVCDMKNEQALLDLIRSSTNPDEALKIALAVIHDALARLEAEPEYPLGDHPAVL